MQRTQCFPRVRVPGAVWPGKEKADQFIGKTLGTEVTEQDLVAAFGLNVVVLDKNAILAGSAVGDRVRVYLNADNIIDSILPH